MAPSLCVSAADAPPGWSLLEPGAYNGSGGAGGGGGLTQSRAIGIAAAIVCSSLLSVLCLLRGQRLYALLGTYRQAWCKVRELRPPAGKAKLRIEKLERSPVVVEHGPHVPSLRARERAGEVGFRAHVSATPHSLSVHVLVFVHLRLRLDHQQHVDVAVW
jgi:hypothetical protein